MVVLDDLDSAQRWIGDWEASIRDQAAKTKSFAQQGAGLTATAADPNRAVEVTVDSAGGVAALHLSEQTRKMPAHELSDLILSVMRAAQAKLAHAMAQVAAETLGEQSEAARAIVTSYERRFATATGDDDGRG